MQLPSYHQLTLVVQDLVDSISQWPSEKAFWRPVGEEGGLILAFQEQGYSGDLELSFALFMLLYRRTIIGKLLK